MDFLESPEVWNGLLNATESDFNPYVALCRSFILQFKVLHPDSLRRYTFWDAVKQCMHYALILDKNSGDLLVPMLDEFDRAATELANASAGDGSTFVSYYGRLSHRSLEEKAFVVQPNWTCTLYPIVEDSRGLSFLSLAVKLGLYSYVSAKANHGCLVKQDTGVWPLLKDAIITDFSFMEFWYGTLSRTSRLPPFGVPSPRIVDLLLKRGADPNFSRNSATPWEHWLKHLGYSHFLEAGTRDLLDIVFQFLVHGADTTINLLAYDGFRQLISERRILPNDHYCQARVREILRKTRKSRLKW